MKSRKAIWLVLKLAGTLCPSFLPLLVIRRLLQTTAPYVNIVGGSILLDALLQKQSFQDIFSVALWMAALNFTLYILCWGFDKLVNIRKYLLDDQIKKMISEKGLTLDYELLEKKETLECIEKAKEGMNSQGDIGVFCDKVADMVEVIANIIYSAVLFYPVFAVTGSGNVSAKYEFILSNYSSWILNLILVVQLFALGWSHRRLGQLQKENFENVLDTNRKYFYYSSFLNEYDKGKDIRMYRLGETIYGKFQQVNESMVSLIEASRKRMEKYSILNECCVMIYTLASYVYVGAKAAFGVITVGSVTRYVGAFTKFSQALGSVVRTYTEISIRAQYLAYFVEFMEIKNKKYEGTLPIEKREDNEYEFEFRDVSFSYPNSEKPVLEHVSMRLKIGKKAAFVGPNGAGKTTFIKLLCRLYDPTEGEILLNGIDIRYYDYEEYIRLFSVVFQDFKLFSFSIAENVAVSKEYEERRVRECLELAGFSERLETMEKGIYTELYKLEEDGVEISGGEAQKIAIARALYKDAPLVILDEPTSALDPVSEYEIYHSFDRLVEEKTAIYISHRMSSCRFCDQIVVFDKGMVVQRGSHEELLEQKDGLYCEMWNAQAQYYQ